MPNVVHVGVKQTHLAASHCLTNKVQTSFVFVFMIRNVLLQCTLKYLQGWFPVD